MALKQLTHAGVFKALVLIFERRQRAVVGARHRQARPAGAALGQRAQQGDAEGGALERVGACEMRG